MTARTIADYTLRELQAISSELPGVGNFPSRILAIDYQEFISVLYEDIDKIVFGFQENPELLQNDGEDRLSSEIKRSLRLLGYKATHDEKIGGHSDIVVRGKRNFLWIGEAKIHSGYDYLFKGFQQLSTRYSTGDANQDCGGMLIYIRNNDAEAVVKSWREHLQSKSLTDYADQDCQQRPRFVFYSQHKHDRSGAPFSVKHIGVILGFDPKDRSPAK